jgi:2',3'-cyclic-nucleotide 2'-phosphodiesterase (5'-nucleotidase family)
MLFDNGDTIQGTALGDYQALVKPVACGELLGIYKVMKGLGYDGAGIGNHDFNYGLAFLARSPAAASMSTASSGKRCAGPGFPAGAGQRLQRQDEKPIFEPYRIIEQARRGDRRRRQAGQATVKVGIIGFTPPTILSWDKRWLEGKVYTEGLVETASATSPRCAPRAPTWWWRFRTAAWMTARTRRTWKTATGTWRRCRASTPCCSAIRTSCSRTRPARSRNSTCRRSTR